MTSKKKMLLKRENSAKLQIEVGNLSIENDNQLLTDNTKKVFAEQSKVSEQVGIILKKKTVGVGIQTIEESPTKSCAKCTRTCEHHAKTKENLKEKIIIIKALKKELELVKKENEKLNNDTLEHAKTAQGFERALEVIKNREETINYLNRRLEALGEKYCLKDQVEFKIERANNKLTKKCEKCVETNKLFEEKQQELKKKNSEIDALKKELDVVKNENTKLINDNNCKEESEHFGRALALIKEKGDTINHLYQRLEEEGSKSRDQMHSLKQRIEELEQSLTSTKILNKNLEKKVLHQTEQIDILRTDLTATKSALEKETHEAQEANHVSFIYYKRIKALEVYEPPEVKRKAMEYEQERQQLRRELLRFDSEYSLEKFIKIKKEVGAMDETDERKSMALNELQVYLVGLQKCHAVYQRNFIHLKEQRSLD